MTAPLTPCAQCHAPHATIDVMRDGVTVAICTPCYEKMTMPAFVKIDNNVFVAQDTRDILLAEIARLEAENARLNAELSALKAQGQGAK